MNLERNKVKRQNITSQLKERVLVLDGAMGTLIQQHNLSESDFRGEEFKDWSKELKGCNDILALTRPDILAQIHRDYLNAGADIISTNTFNATTISLRDYGLEGYSYTIAKRAAEIARAEADKFSDRGCYVAGSLGPTSHTASMSAEVTNPAARDITFDDLVEAYSTQLSGLVDGGVDLIIIETIFDTLNAKAAIYAIEKICKERDIDLPIMASGTITDASGRTLSGQTIEAFYTSLSHANLLSIGLNCAFGAKQMLPYVERLAAVAECYTSAYPNAGLPNIMGGYDETPEMFAADAELYLQSQAVNIIGGCCGTTPRHIELLRGLVDRYQPRTPQQPQHTTTLSGLETLKISAESNFINIGERCNVAGSAKFARLIREGNFDEALSIARAQVDAGAQIVDVCMDDGMIEGKEAMCHFINLLGSEPEIARVPLMIDSSKWEVLRAGLKVTQGKSIVNSISLKEGEQSFLQKALEIHSFGAAAVVMLFDESGQADTYERKIEIAQRAYTLLTEAGFPSEDIIFDPNVLAVATGIEAHDSYGKAFIEATRWIKGNLPNAKVSGGVSNLSFSFRGNNTIREAMHSVFLYHAIEAGMDMAIVNAQMLQIYDQIEPTLLKRVEDVILCRGEDAAERLIELAEELKSQNIKGDKPSAKSAEEWRTLPLKERVDYAMVKGIVDHIEADTLEGYNELQVPMRVIDELLMPAMEHVGVLFGEGKMFLPQVVKTARVMKKAVGVLTPYIEESKGSEVGSSATGKVLVATVKGDVHDIGKNIVSVVMACNGYEIHDLGVMVETLRIVEEANTWGADAICLSGLITPSLEEMIRVAEECERRGYTTPIIIGGATTSPIHTAVKIAPHYPSGVVIHANNASDNPKILSQLLGENRDLYIDHIKAEQQALRGDYERALKLRDLLPLAEARANATSTTEVIEPQHTGRLVFADFDIADVEELIDWNFFFTSWGLKGHYPEIFESERYGEEAKKIFEDAQALLAQIKEGHKLTLQGVVAILKARKDGDDIVVTSTKGKEVRLAMLRNQTRSEANSSLADMISTKGDHIGCFAVTAGVGLDALTAEFKEAGDDYSAMLAKLLADRLTEAFAHKVHIFVRRQMWGYETCEPLTAKDVIREKYQGVRMAFGYPATPDHSLKREIFELLSTEMTTHMKLDRESYMISPAESLCGVMISRGEYFSVGSIDDEQLKDYARRRKMTIEEIKKLIPYNI
ncbi:MAG: methionine synthase [Rikenellaceae bacterium]